jgi:hypothetical protein
MAASVAVFCAFKSRKFSRIASTEPARVDVVVISRISIIDALREVQRRFGPSAAGGAHAKPIAEFVAALIQIHEAEHRFAQQLAGELQRGVRARA